MDLYGTSAVFNSEWTGLKRFFLVLCVGLKNQHQTDKDFLEEPQKQFLSCNQNYLRDKLKNTIWI